MKTEIRAMLPMLPPITKCYDLIEEAEVIDLIHFEAWLDKLTEGATIRYATNGGRKLYIDQSEGDTHMHLCLAGQIIKKQTPLEILKESMQHIRDKSTDPLARKQAEWALEQIEAAK